ncbi:3484_t:CDS:2 [Cetraspora pellucida]|uniref:3484_t:CDS:1 n=1 Tax=Cetraspora pellucida TaxID=1433469 RepID=A0A9N9CFS4_9GLOM|nr:3484_t:CDS:2 [Cetraspora pellucida]
MNRLIKEGVKSTSSLCDLHKHIQNLLDNEAKFGKIKKALNIALNLGCEEELIDIITHFVDQKKSILESTNDENVHLDQSEQIIVMDSFVTKHRKWPPTRRLKGFSESQGYKEPAHNNYAINSSDSNLRIPLSNASSNNSSYIVKESK